VADPTVTARTIQGRSIYIGRATAQVLAKNRVSFSHDTRAAGVALKLGTDACHTRTADWIRQERRRVARGHPNYFRPYYLTQAT
jgi:hypothetical protein